MEPQMDADENNKKEKTRHWCFPFHHVRMNPRG